MAYCNRRRRLKACKKISADRGNDGTNLPVVSDKNHSNFSDLVGVTTNSFLRISVFFTALFTGMLLVTCTSEERSLVLVKNPLNGIIISGDLSL